MTNLCDDVRDCGIYDVGRIAVILEVFGQREIEIFVQSGICFDDEETETFAWVGSDVLVTENVFLAMVISYHLQIFFLEEIFRPLEVFLISFSLEVILTVS